MFPTPTRFVALLAIPALWVWRWWETRRRDRSAAHFIPRTPLDGAILGIALMVLVSLYATFDIAFSLPKIAGLVYAIAFYYGVVDVATRSRLLLGWSIAAFVLAGLGLSVVALVGTRWPVKYKFLEPLVTRLPGALRGVPGAEAGFHGNEVAGTLMWFIPFAFALLVALIRYRKGWTRLLGSTGNGLALLVMVGIVILSQSRGGLGGVVAGLLGMIVWLGWWGQGVVGAAVAAGLAAVFYVGPEQVADILLSRIEVEPLGTIYLTGRLELWSRAIYGIQDFPFTGMGLNTFRRVVHVLYPLFEIPSFLENDIGHAHNHLLQAALDLGLPGLIAYMALWGLAAGLVIRVWRGGADQLLRACALGVFGSLVAYFVYGITDTVALGAKPGVVFWALLALAVAVWQQAAHSAPADTCRMHQTKPGGCEASMVISTAAVGSEDVEASAESDNVGVVGDSVDASRLPTHPNPG